MQAKLGCKIHCECGDMLYTSKDELHLKCYNVDCKQYLVEYKIPTIELEKKGAVKKDGPKPKGRKPKS